MCRGRQAELSTSENILSFHLVKGMHKDFGRLSHCTVTPQVNDENIDHQTHQCVLGKWDIWHSKTIQSFKTMFYHMAQKFSFETRRHVLLQSCYHGLINQVRAERSCGAPIAPPIGSSLLCAAGNSASSVIKKALFT